jgi:hypothetical protein
MIYKNLKTKKNNAPNRMIHIHARSEKELEPRSVGTSAAFGETPPIKLCG